MSDAIVKSISTKASSDLSVGETFLRFEKQVAPSPSAAAQLRQDAISILSQASFDISGPSRTTGLVVGHVQSGKTLSYEGVVSLARDNNYALIVVITGISNPLLEQSVRRLTTDLKKSSPAGWHFVTNPSSASPQNVQQFGALREDWMDPETPLLFKKPIVAVVLKNYSRIEKLIDLAEGQDWSGMKVLIIDDEADQASLNGRVQQGESSTTHAQLTHLRKQFPNHAYIQYTATPQAPLLIHLADVLSPDYVRVLTPGEGYVGGETFFVDRPELVETIPSSDIVSESAIAPELPASLLQALRLYFLGVAYSINKGYADGPKSMLVHPSRGVALHAHYLLWVTQVRSSWMDILNSPDEANPDRAELLADFELAHQELSKTLSDLPPLAELLVLLKFAIRKTQVVEMNTRDGSGVPEIKWEDSVGFILVGGQALDRGFTVEGLTVTYMPRSLGVGNADTLQQRARFFGYKKSYLGLCRVFLETEVKFAFEQYVRHESDMHTRLLKIEESGQSLNDWQRVFLLDASLKPTRSAVLSSHYVTGNFSDSWSVDLRPSLLSVDIEKNRNSVEEVCSKLSFNEFPGHEERTPAQRHLRADIRLKDLFNFLQKQVVTDPDSSLAKTGLLLQLTEALDIDPDKLCTLIRMRPEATEERALNDTKTQIKALFQGPSRRARGHSDGDVYPGDTSIIESDRLTVQIHNVHITNSVSPLPPIPVLAVWVPSSIGDAWYVQQTN